MDALARIERSLVSAVARAETPGGPPRLAAAVRHAVFPGGARVRPRLCLAVAGACGGGDPAAAEAAASAIELLHCASLVHDDMPCFDDAATRRGKPSVHRAFGECLALLAGDALIVLAFETLARELAASPGRLASLLLIVGRSAGMPLGIVAGQAWECEPRVDLAAYQRAKTASLFAAATMAGAVAGGGEADRWRELGEKLGEAYQVADDIRDAVADEAELGKPAGQDAARARPSAALALGVEGALARLESLVEAAVAAIPPCPGQDDLRRLIAREVVRLVPKGIARRAA